MHESSYLRMQWFVETHVQPSTVPLCVLDVGSYGVNGCYRPLFPTPQFAYSGLDMAPGPNVDLVPAKPYHWSEIQDNAYDIVISGQAFEHIEFFWVTLGEMARVLAPNGLLCVIAPRNFVRHRHPVDCYRFDEDAMLALARYGNLVPLHVSMELAPSGAPQEWYGGRGDAMLVARKPEDWAGMLQVAEYTFAPADLPQLRTGFLSKSEQPRTPEAFSTPSRVHILAKTFNAERYLEIGVATGKTFFAVDMPYKVAVDPDFLFDPEERKQPGTAFFPQPSDDFFADLRARPADAPALVPGMPGDGVVFDIIFIDGLHTFEQSFRDFENSLAFAHENTIWIIDDTVPIDPYTAIPDQGRSRALRHAAGLKGRPWHGDVFKTVFAIHDAYPEFSYCTLTGGNPQTVLWRTERSDRKPVFSSFEEISRLGYFDMLDHAGLMMPVADSMLLSLLGQRLAPHLYENGDAWKKLCKSIVRGAVPAAEPQKRAAPKVKSEKQTGNAPTKKASVSQADEDDAVIREIKNTLELLQAREETLRQRLARRRRQLRKEQQLDAQTDAEEKA